MKMVFRIASKLGFLSFFLINSIHAGPSFSRNWVENCIGDLCIEDLVRELPAQTRYTNPTTLGRCALSESSARDVYNLNSLKAEVRAIANAYGIRYGDSTGSESTSESSDSSDEDGELFAQLRLQLNSGHPRR